MTQLLEQNLTPAKALYQETDMSAREIVEKGLNIAADICVFTNHNLTIESLSAKDTSK